MNPQSLPSFGNRRGINIIIILFHRKTGQGISTSIILPWTILNDESHFARLSPPGRFAPNMPA